MLVFKRQSWYLLLTFILLTGISKPVVTSTSTTAKVLITGGAGFIGSNFLIYMFDKYPQYSFIVLDVLTYAGDLANIPAYIHASERFKFIRGSVTDVELVEAVMSDVDFVVHFAAESHVTRSIQEDKVFFETDVLGTRSMMAALVKHKNRVQRFIHISTSEVFGTAEESPMTEDHPLNPRTPYAAAKAGADRLVYAYWCTYDIPAVIVRPFNNYGPQQHLEKLIPRFIYQAITHQPLIVHGDGEQKRDWVHTRDVARALDIILHKSDFNNIKNQVINLGSGNAVSVNTIADIIINSFNLPLDFKQYISDRPGQVALHVSSTEKAYKLLGWRPEIPLQRGLMETIAWYKENTGRLEEKYLNSIIPLAVLSSGIEKF